MQYVLFQKQFVKTLLLCYNQGVCGFFKLYNENEGLIVNLGHSFMANIVKDWEGKVLLS